MYLQVTLTFCNNSDANLFCQRTEKISPYNFLSVQPLVKYLALYFSLWMIGTTSLHLLHTSFKIVFSASSLGCALGAPEQVTFQKLKKQPRFHPNQPLFDDIWIFHMDLAKILDN